MCVSERGIQRETECTHEWVRPLFQKIWPETQDILKTFMLQWSDKQRAAITKKAHVCVCVRLHSQNMCNIQMLHVLNIALSYQYNVNISLDLHPAWIYSIDFFIFIATCRPVLYIIETFQTEGAECCMISPSRTDYVTSCGLLSLLPTCWHVEPRWGD